MANLVTRVTKHYQSITEDQVRAQLDKVLASTGFIRAGRMRRFLTFIVEARLTANYKSEELKECLVGAAVFDRHADYDPKSDPVVRVEARRLRAKLEEYYDSAGRQDGIRIDLPKGSYVPVWSWQVEPQPEIREGSGRRNRRWILGGVAIGVTLLILAAIWGRTEWQKRAPDQAHLAASNLKIRSLAILPFRNLSGNPAQEYLVAGLTDEITTELAKIHGLKVISRTSSEQYRTSKKRLPEIARELNVDAIVEGTFLSSADHVRVSAQLIRAATDSHIWAESYQRNGTDLFTLQSEIAANITREIDATLAPGTRLTARDQPVNAEAYDLYLRGRYFWNRRTLDGLEKSIDYYERAIRIDPNYAKLYAALGDSYVLLSSYGGPDPAVSFARAQHAAEQALQLDSSLAEAHTVLAAVKVGYDWDWQGAASEYRQALALDPNYPTAHHWYSLLLTRIGQFSEAETQIKRALDLDPLSLIINTDAGEVFYCARQPDDALAHLRRALELDPNFAEAHLVLGKVYEQKKNFEMALAEFDRANQLFGSSPNIATLRAHALALAGKRDEALAIARKLEQTSAHRYVSGVDMAMIYCALGDTDKGMAYLDKAYQSRGKGLDIIGTDPLFDGCRSDPRFETLLHRLHLIE